MKSIQAAFLGSLTLFCAYYAIAGRLILLLQTGMIGFLALGFINVIYRYNGKNNSTSSRCASKDVK